MVRKATCFRGRESEKLARVNKARQSKLVNGFDLCLAEQEYEELATQSYFERQK